MKCYKSIDVLITGGTGFVAGWMKRTILPDDIFPVYQSQINYGTKWELGHWDSIVHLAPIAPTRVLKYAKEHGTKVLFASSGAVYGEVPNYSGYAQQKREWEEECAQGGVECIIARMFTFVGKGLNRHSVYEFIQQAKSGKITVLSPESVRSYLYGEDLGRWIWKLLLEGYGTYDVGGSMPYTILEVARIVADVIPCKVLAINSEAQTIYLPNVTRAHALGCRETIGLKEAIERSI
jgi:nucleoside-diphosphate-sugar epimerase